jgi:predicted ribosomally synthesized peptide with SipW-like signal peptide
MTDGSMPATRGSMLAARRGTRSTRLRLVAGAISLVTATAGLAGVATNAWFTDTDTITANTFSSGTVSLTATPATSALTLTNMAPSDTVTAPITVTNAGTLAQRYAVTSGTTENTLAAQLDLTIKSGVTTCTTGAFGASGTIIYGPADLGSTTPTKVVGDSAVGSQAGDRPLAVSANEVLCLQVSLPLGTNDTFQSLTSTATLTFNAEQTINNP